MLHPKDGSWHPVQAGGGTSRGIVAWPLRDGPLLDLSWLFPIPATATELVLATDFCTRYGLAQVGLGFRLSETAPFAFLQRLGRQR